MRRVLYVNFLITILCIMNGIEVGLGMGPYVMHSTTIETILIFIQKLGVKFYVGMKNIRYHGDTSIRVVSITLKDTNNIDPNIHIFMMSVFPGVGLVQELLDWYRWRCHMMMSMNREYGEKCKPILLPDGRFDKLSVYLTEECNPGWYNDRRIHIPEGYITTNIFDKNGRKVAKLPEKYYYSSGTNLYSWLESVDKY